MDNQELREVVESVNPIPFSFYEIEGKRIFEVRGSGKPHWIAYLIHSLDKETMKFPVELHPDLDKSQVINRLLDAKAEFQHRINEYAGK